MTTLINSIMRSPCWSSTAIFLSWDDWGGFYDHIVPPPIDENGYGFRVPGLVISPYLLLGCNMECSVYALGHLNLMRHRRHLGLRGVLTTLTAGHATRIALSLSHANLSAVHRALEKSHPVKATVEVQAGSGGERQLYGVEVVLSWR